jgi:hypothetical protein
MGIFEEAQATADAVDALHTLGVRDDRIVIMTGVPYPERALGRHVEWLRLPQIVVAGALGGLVVGLFLSVITPHLYRLDVGGHPTVSFAPAAVITFVFAMMATIIATFLGVLWEMDFPEFGPKFYHESVTNGRIALLVEFTEKQKEQVIDLLQEHGAQDVHEPEKQPL